MLIKLALRLIIDKSPHNSMINDDFLKILTALKKISPNKNI